MSVSIKQALTQCQRDINQWLLALKYFRVHPMPYKPLIVIKISGLVLSLFNPNDYTRDSNHGV